MKSKIFVCAIVMVTVIGTVVYAAGFRETETPVVVTPEEIAIEQNTWTWIKKINWLCYEGGYLLNKNKANEYYKRYKDVLHQSEKPLFKRL